MAFSTSVQAEPTRSYGVAAFEHTRQSLPASAHHLVQALLLQVLPYDSLPVSPRRPRTAVARLHTPLPPPRTVLTAPSERHEWINVGNRVANPTTKSVQKIPFKEYREGKPPCNREGNLSQSVRT